MLMRFDTWPENADIYRGIFVDEFLFVLWLLIATLRGRFVLSDYSCNHQMSTTTTMICHTTKELGKIQP